MAKTLSKKMRAASANEPLNMTPTQKAYYNESTRFVVVPAGRRSGKTAIAKRRLRKRALLTDLNIGTRFIAAAPTFNQAKRIYWQDFLAMFPEPLRRDKVNKTELIIPLITGADVQVMGMEVPERAEGSPIGHLLLDEYGNMKGEAWDENLYPALIDSQGTADVIGVPEGRNHYYRQWQYAKSGEDEDWTGYTWFTSEVLPYYLGEKAASKEIRNAKRRMDAVTYRQEFEASFETFTGRAYWAFDPQKHAIERVRYNPNLPLCITFDFNTSPGVCVYAQEKTYRGKATDVSGRFTAVIGEVYIPRNSNTKMVCERVIKDWGQRHKGKVYLYGDQTGANPHASSTEGSDWDIIWKMMYQVFGDRLFDRVPTGNPRERARVNSVNARLESVDGTVAMLIDPVNCPKLIEDLDGVMVKPETDGEIDKKIDPSMTHISDALGYYVHEEHPAGDSKDIFSESLL